MWSFLFTHTPLFYFTQSVWRDEAFSILLAQRPVSTFLTHITLEPPIYYILLHYWMKIFGTSEIAARSLSLLGFTIATIIIIIWAEKMFHKHWLSWFLPLFFFFNPELMYYAFEIRAYGWYMLFACASLYAYVEKKYFLYIIATTLGLYTHTYMIIVPVVQMLHYLYIQRNVLYSKKRFSLLTDTMIKSFIITGICFSPWFIKVISELSRLKQSWYFPPNGQLVLTVIGNIFLGYEGTPGYLWPFTALVSLLILFLSFYAIFSKKRHALTSFFSLLVYFPLVIIIGISFIKPVFVNRYILPSTIAEIFLIVFAIERIQNKRLQQFFAASALIFVIGFNLWYPGKYAKVDIRSTIYQINALASTRDIILTDSPLVLFETMYYSSNPNVYWYNPRGAPFPWYIGDIIVTPSQIVRDLPPYPLKAFIVHTDGSFDITFNAPAEK